MDITSVHCLREIIFSLACAFSNPMEHNIYYIDQPSYLSKVKHNSFDTTAFYFVPKEGPIILAKPSIFTKNSPQEEIVRAIEKPRRREIVKKEEPIVLASFAPSPVTGLMALLRGNKPKNKEEKRKSKGTKLDESKIETFKGKTLFVKSDGNEQTDCLVKNKRLTTAMQKIRAHFGKPLVIESAYRSPAYNAALRKRSRGVAKHSQHMNCAAIDFRVAGVGIATLGKYVRSLPEIGGVGYYSNWIHMDTGSNRSW